MFASHEPSHQVQGSAQLADSQSDGTRALRIEYLPLKFPQTLLEHVKRRTRTPVAELIRHVVKISADLFDKIIAIALIMSDQLSRRII